MDSRSRDFAIAVGFLILGISCNHGELLTISRLEQSAGSDVRTTCVSENGYATLVWNLLEDGSAIPKKGPDFFPRKPKPTGEYPNCAIWKNDQCSVNWTTIQNHSVSSWSAPMGPVFDYRWERFTETSGMEIHAFLGYQFFSVGNLRTMQIIISDQERKVCWTITVEKSIDEAFFTTCEGEVDPEYPYCSRNDSVTPLRGFQGIQDTDIFGIGQWRTFGIDVDIWGERISIMEGNKVKTFAVENLELTFLFLSLCIVSGRPLFMKSHRYAYILLTKTDELVSTSDFYLPSEYFCIELFVGLCSHCQLLATLRSDSGTISLGSIDGVENSTIHGLLVWRPVRLNATIPNLGDKRVRLELRAELKNVNAQGRWAVDSLRWCEPAEILDSLRGLSDVSGSPFPCFGPVYLICNPTGCTCDRGFGGLECNTSEICTSAANRSDEKLLLPFCRTGSGNTEGQNMIWLTVFSLIPLGILLLFIRYRVWLKNPRSLSETPGNVPAESVDCNGYLVPSAALNRRNWIFPAMMNLDNGSLYEDIGFDGQPYDPRNHIVEVSRFEHYLEDGFASGLLKLQYEHVSDGPPKACEYGKLIPNLAKNRSRDMIAYDETRVSLEKIPGDSYSDYINANYIRGYRQVPAYIATQGPTPNTMGDFWRMVWQEKTSFICMVTDLIKNGEVLCEQYWPEIHKRSKYEYIDVLNAGEVELDDYVLRTFHVRCGDKTREVTHLQYTGSWPKKGVLAYSSSLVTYLKKLLAIPSGEGLVVVHGSLGVGRTGVIILCDICLRRALHDKIINVPATTVRMREDRGNMVENEHYYLLAHVLISVCLLAAETQDSLYTEILY